MGNLMFVSYRRKVTDKKFSEYLEHVNQNHFNNGLVIEHENEEYSWSVKFHPDIYNKFSEEDQKDWDLKGFEIYRQSGGKFGNKYGHLDFMNFLRCKLHNCLAAEFNGYLSDEGVNEIWRGDIKKYTTFNDYINNYTSNFEDREDLQKMIRERMLNYTPEILRGW
jgi:hypothetical protein